MSVIVMNTSTTSAAAYVAARKAGNEQQMEQCFEAILQWLAFEFEQDGKTGAEIDGMDLKALAHDLIERAA